MLVKGSIATPDEFVRRRWCAEKNRLFTRTDELAFCREWVGQFRSKLSADLDEALALVGEHFDGSDIHASGTLRSGNIKPDVAREPPPGISIRRIRAMSQTLEDAKLTALLNDLESDRVERKQSFGGKAPETVREAVCAFANDLSGHQAPGVVFIGAKDDGTPMDGFTVSDDLLRSLADIKTDGNIVPPPTLLVEKRRLGGADHAVVTVWPCDTPPVRYKGRIHVRWGPRRGLATAQDERHPQRATSVP